MPAPEQLTLAVYDQITVEPTPDVLALGADSSETTVREF